MAGAACIGCRSDGCAHERRCGLTADGEDEGQRQPPETSPAAQPEARPQAPAGASPPGASPISPGRASRRRSRARATGATGTSTRERRGERRRLRGSPICQVKSPFEEMPPGCPQDRPRAGSECPQGSEGARCPGGMGEGGD